MTEMTDDFSFLDGFCSIANWGSLHPNDIARFKGLIENRDERGPIDFDALEAYLTRQSAKEFSAKVNGTRTIERLLEFAREVG